MGNKQGYETLKFQKKSGETLPHKGLVPGRDYDALNDHNYDAEVVVEEDGKDIFGQEGELAEEVEESKNNEEQERFLEENDPEDLEGVTKE